MVGSVVMVLVSYDAAAGSRVSTHILEASERFDATQEARWDHER